MSECIIPEVQPIEELFNEKLVIPEYQRPYRWRENHIIQLIDDLKNNAVSSDEYRIGTVVLYQAEDKALEIVDGQQRTITLCLLLAAINDKIKNKELPELLKLLTLSHPESQQQAMHNSAFIKEYISHFEEQELCQLFDFILKSCSVVVIRLSDLGEAFQFFDSQNARGKALEPHDLLKAFHLREMKNDNEQEKLFVIENWESEASTGGELKSIFSDYLYRLRRWNKGKKGRYFTNKDIDVFKGLDINSDELPVFMQVALRAHVFTNNYNQAPTRLVDKQSLNYPHQINQVIINGARFFEYISNYIEQKRLLLNNPEVKQYLVDYKGSGRSGDMYTRNLFLAVLLQYKDKFGDQNFELAARLCFVWAYKLRLENARVQFASVDNYARASNSLIRLIESAVTAKEVLRYVVIKDEEAVQSNKTKGLSKLHKLYLGKELNND